MISDEDFLPEKETRELEQAVKQSLSIKIENKRQDNFLRHNEEYSGTLFKYDLPIVNKAIEFKSQIVVQEESALTSMENMFELLDCDKDTAWESFVIKHN